MPKTITRWLADVVWRLWYPLLTRLARDTPLVFLNYGYDETDGSDGRLELREQDEPDRVCIQLYERVTQPVDMRELDVLEVSCGHGGGASYVARYRGPRSVHALDRNSRAIELCNRRHRVAGLTFYCGGAADLPFSEETFDVVLNVEASHCYPDVPRFFREVCRVLRPGGHFLFADFRCSGSDVALLDQQLDQSGLQFVSRQDISSQVVRGMRLNTSKYLRLIETLLPAPFRPYAKRFAGVEGSPIYNDLAGGQKLYLCYHLRKHGNSQKDE